MHKLPMVIIVILTIVFSTLTIFAQVKENPLAILTAENAPFVTGDKILFFGDVITEQGEDGNGFITLLRRQFNSKPETAVTLINAGVSANRVPDLQRRFERDVLNVKPNIVFIQIGINDAWRTDWGGGTKIDRYEAGLRDMIGKMLAKGIYVILATPSLNGELAGGANAQDITIDEYAEISRKIARDLKIGLCDLRTTMTAYVKLNNPDNNESGILTTDGIHLNDKGNELLAVEAAKTIVDTIQQRGPQPVVMDKEFYSPGEVTIQMRLGLPTEGVTVRYSIDGTDPIATSPAYTEPFAIKHTAIIKARAFIQGKPVGVVASANYTELFPRQAENPNDTQPGLKYSFYAGNWPLLPDFTTMTAQSTGISALIDLTVRKQEENYGILFTGYIDVPKAGIYTFTLISDDGSKMWLGDKMIIVNDGQHGATPASGEIRLSAGKHAISIAFMQGGGGASLEARWKSAEVAEQIIPADALWHTID